MAGIRVKECVSTRINAGDVYHNIPSRDRQGILLETLRVLKKGGCFAIHDIMSKAKYDDIEAFAYKLRFNEKQYEISAKSVENAKTPADCLTFKAADGRKLCEDAGNDIFQKGKAYISSFTASAL